MHTVKSFEWLEICVHCVWKRDGNVCNECNMQNTIVTGAIELVSRQTMKLCSTCFTPERRNSQYKDPI